MVWHFLSNSSSGHWRNEEWEFTLCLYLSSVRLGERDLFSAQIDSSRKAIVVQRSPSDAMAPQAQTGPLCIADYR